MLVDAPSPMDVQQLGNDGTPRMPPPRPQRHWSWMGLDRSFKDQTSKMGDIHHWAWRANGANESVYLREADERM